MPTKFKKYNTLRNQIILLFSIVSFIIVLTITAFGYNKFSTIYDDIMQSQLEQTSIELNSAMEAKYAQINSIASQVTTDEDIEKLTYELNQSEGAITKQQEKQFKKVLRRYYPYVTTIYDYRFYKNDGTPLFPVEKSLQNDIDADWIEKAEQAQGKLIWVGQDSNSTRYSYAIKLIRSMNHSFVSSGYLVLKLENAYFETQFGNDENFIQIFDSTNRLVAGPELPNLLHSTSDELVYEGEKYKIVKSISHITNWTVYVAQSMTDYTEQIRVIRYFMLMIATIVLIISIVLAWIFASSLTKPLKRLTKVLRINRKHHKMILMEESQSSNDIQTLEKTYNQFILHINQLMEEIYEKQRLQKNAELKAWQSQINPHFLYNTLNSFYWHLIANDEEELAEHVLAMSDLFKYTINSVTHSDTVTIAEEINHITNYLKLMKMRIGERLQWEIDCPPHLLQVKIPKLLLQPLIENALIHGIEPLRTNGLISLQMTEHDDKRVKISIQDSGPGIPLDIIDKLNKMIDLSSSNDNIGIQNIRMRLQMHYAQAVADSLRFYTTVPTGTVVEMIIPKEDEFL